MNDVPMQVQLPQRRRNICHKIGRLNSLGYNEVARFTELLYSQISGLLNKHSKQIYSKKHTYNMMLELITTDEKYILLAEQIIDQIESEHGIISGENIFLESLKDENKLRRLIEYGDTELLVWMQNKLSKITTLCGNDESAALEVIKTLVIANGNMNSTEHIIPQFKIEKLLFSDYKNILIDAMIKCTVGYTFGCSGVLA